MTSTKLAFFRAISTSGARALLIGRRALVVLGLPVLTADYDFWLHFDDAECIWTRRQTMSLASGLAVVLPSLADLVLTKRFASRPKDLEDIRMLEILRRERGQ